MSYKPPFARMRQIKKNAPAPISRVPQNVTEALKEAVVKQDAGEEVATEIRVPVGILDAVIKPGDDKVYGTEDDLITIEGHKDDDAHEHDEPGDPEELKVPETFEPETVVEPEIEVEPESIVEEKAVTPAKPKYDMTMRKDTLIAVAEAHGLSSEGTKREIIARLDAFRE